MFDEIEFERMKRLPNYVFAQVNAIKMEARRAGVDVIDFSAKDKIYSYYRSPMSLSQDETIVIRSDTTGICIRAEGNDDSRFSLWLTDHIE